MDMRVDTATVVGQKLRYAVMGPAGATRTLLAFNGIGASLDSFAPFAERFSRTRIVIFDAPGVGGSPAPLLPYRFANLTRMTARLLDRLKIDAVDVFGVSWGGGLAQQFAHDFQPRCRTLTLAATSAGVVMRPGDMRVLAKMATPRRYADPTYMMTAGPQIYGGRLRASPELLRQHAEGLKGGSRRGYLYQLLAGAGWTSWLWLPQLKLPTLILMGEDDPIVPVDNARILANRLPDATVKILPCGHLFLLTEPAMTAALVEDFIHGGQVAAA